MELRATGDNAAAKIVKEVTTTTPTRGKRMLSKWRAKDVPRRQLSEEEAVSLIVTAQLTKSQYLFIRETAKFHGHDIYPNYERVKKAKKVTYPEGITIEEEKCEVDLQSLLNHTASRIISFIVQSGKEISASTCKLICKWGFDGSSGHSRYKQTWQTSNVKDDSLFATSLVPLQLLDSASGEYIWSNPHPSSARFCRPIRIQWVQETKEISKAEENYVRDQINNLQLASVGNVVVKFELLLTMIDGKVCSALTETSCMRCYLCGARISEMNNLNKIKKMKVDESKFSFGLSILHCYIRFFECLLHISYRLDIKMWKVKSADGSKIAMERRKKIVQNGFRSRMGLIVDLPKPGFGTTNDGNTARRFFANPALSAEISGKL
ncbi:uncharacterized protein LOC124155152 [Ischnura elegans]|uniref:uncharacterized protein LOC124155152 n=1 Tax=Ischnura elegans TaxID=197161 RepID=UPI001ED8B264|nr:uncharacterized protein LOC124155152 [Ischnura elegans]